MKDTTRSALMALRHGTIETRSRGPAAPAPSLDRPRSPEQRSALLGEHLTRSLAAGGRLESHTGHTAVITYGSQPNHILHLLLTVLTFGLWLAVWAALAMTAKRSRVMLSVDECGNVTRAHISR